MFSFQEQQLIRLNVEGDVMASLTPQQRLGRGGKDWSPDGEPKQA